MRHSIEDGQSVHDEYRQRRSDVTLAQRRGGALLFPYGGDVTKSNKEIVLEVLRGALSSEIQPLLRVFGANTSSTTQQSQTARQQLRR